MVPENKVVIPDFFLEEALRDVRKRVKTALRLGQEKGWVYSARLHSFTRRSALRRWRCLR